MFQSRNIDVNSFWHLTVLHLHIKQNHPPRTSIYGLTEQQRADLRTIFPCCYPATPSMASFRDRMNTFNHWNFTRASPEMLAEAGFFSLGWQLFTHLRKVFQTNNCVLFGCNLSFKRVCLTFHLLVKETRPSPSFIEILLNNSYITFYLK